jgi:hypothetical protein
MITTVRVLFIGAWRAVAGHFVAVLMSIAAEADERDEIEPERVRERERV